jgi:hypothetical protein
MTSAIPPSATLRQFQRLSTPYLYGSLRRHQNEGFPVPAKRLLVSQNFCSAIDFADAIFCGWKHHKKDSSRDCVTSCVKTSPK